MYFCLYCSENVNDIGIELNTKVGAEHRVY